MSLNIPSKILSLNGQKINQIQFNDEDSSVHIRCSRDKRRAAVDPVTGQHCRINKLIKRKIRDTPLMGHMCTIEIELAQVYINKNERRIERSPFVEKGVHFTDRLCQLVSGLCRHMSIQAVSNHLKIRWETVKNIDKKYLHKTLPALDPGQLKNLKYIGVDEVARAKGHDYMTVVYDMLEGHLIWVETGRTSDVFSQFLKQLPSETAACIEAVAMDMGPAYQKSVRDCLPNADIVFDRFHVMKLHAIRMPFGSGLAIQQNIRISGKFFQTQSINRNHPRTDWRAFCSFEHSTCLLTTVFNVHSAHRIAMIVERSEIYSGN
ncbi:Mobile element protein [hydrothermal vent metagenome]|uniref:Mobile element protein n=1 Tax=hydrothermal vent metagenome TaxID=652676 RepID=A0A3B0Y7P6_9ZZZZ